MSYTQPTSSGGLIKMASGSLIYSDIRWEESVCRPSIAYTLKESMLLFPLTAGLSNKSMVNTTNSTNCLSAS